MSENKTIREIKVYISAPVTGRPLEERKGFFAMAAVRVVKDKKTNEYELLKRVSPKDGVIDQNTCVFERCVFADGTPFGIKDE